MKGGGTIRCIAPSLTKSIHKSFSPLFSERELLNREIPRYSVIRDTGSSDPTELPNSSWLLARLRSNSA